MKYDIIGDVHGCHDELLRLMKKLGYSKKRKPRKRQLVFVGDLVNNGPDSVAVLQLVMKLVNRGIAIMVLGNHDYELKRILQGKQPCTGKFCNIVRDIGNVSPQFADEVVQFLKAQPTSLVLDGNVLVVHAAYRDGVSAKRGKRLAVFGDDCGQGCEQWVRDYDGEFNTIVRGHRVVPYVTLSIASNGACIYDVDTGCANGGKLSALRLPEQQVVQVTAESAYVQRNWKRTRRRTLAAAA